MVNLSNMSNPTYDRLKKSAQLILPALGTLYFTLSQIWGLPYGEEVVGSIAAINTFLGATVVIASSQYKARHARYDGDLVVNHDETGKIMYRMELEKDPNELAGQDEFRLKVVQEK